jgi:hypothetical protein
MVPHRSAGPDADPKETAMTLTRKIVATLALVCVSAPAFAHGHGGMSPGGNQPQSYQHNEPSTNHDKTTNKSTQITTPASHEHVRMLTPLQKAKVILHLSPILQRLVREYGAALAAGNKFEIARTLREIQHLNEIAVRDDVVVFFNQGAGGHNIEIGRLPGRILLDGKSVQI